MNNDNKTKVRYRVKHNDLNYEYVLHSNKHRFLKNLADVVNVVEYCIGREIKNGFDPNGKYILEITRLVNDKVDETWNSAKFDEAIRTIISQMVEDYLQRNADNVNLAIETIIR